MTGGAPSRAPEPPAEDRGAIVRPGSDPIIVEADDPALRRARSVNRQRLVWSNRSGILKAAAIGFVISTVIALLIPRRFASTARLMPPDQNSSTMGMGMAMMAVAGSTAGSQLGPNLGSVAGDLLGLKNSSDLFVGILHSRTVEDDLVNKFNLKKLYWDRRMEDARDDLEKHTDVTTDRKTGIISIRVSDSSPQRAAAMAGEYVSELNRVVIQLNTTAAHRERVFLEDRLTQVKQDLETAEEDFSQFAGKKTALDIPAQGRAMIEVSAALEGQYIVAQTELEGLRQIYADGNIRVRAAQARVAELQQQLKNQVVGKPREATPADAAGASLYPSVRELPALGVAYADLYRNTRVQELVFQMLTQQYEMAKVQEAKETPSVRMLDPPDVPEKRSFPPRVLIIVVGTMLAIVSSVYWLFSKQAWDQTEQGDPQKLFALEVIHTLRAYSPRVMINGASGNGRTAWARFRRNGKHLESGE